MPTNQMRLTCAHVAGAELTRVTGEKN